MFKKIFCITIYAVLCMSSAVNVNAESSAVSISNWSTGFISNSSAGIYVDADVKISRDVYHSGVAAVQIVNRSEKFSNVYVRFKNDITGLKDDKSYICTFWAKAENLKEVIARVAWGTETTSLALYTGTYDWTEFKFEFPNTSRLTSTDLSFLVLDKCDSLWIDDVGFYEKGEDGKPTGENLLLNPGFEIGLDLIAPREVKDVNVIAGDGKLKINWQNPSDKDFAGVLVYRIDEDGSENMVASVLNGENSVLIENLINGIEYYFKLYTIDTADNKSTGREISGTPIEPGYRITEAVFDKIDEQGEVIQKNLTQLTAGFIKCTVQVQNNHMGNEFDVELILTVHDGDTLLSVNSEYLYVSETGNAQMLSAVIEVPELTTGDYSLEALLWNHLSGMEPLADLGQLK
jgi:hypothetical protein